MMHVCVPLTKGRLSFVCVPKKTPACQDMVCRMYTSRGMITPLHYACHVISVSMQAGLSYMLVFLIRDKVS